MAPTVFPSFFLVIFSPLFFPLPASLHRFLIFSQYIYHYLVRESAPFLILFYHYLVLLHLYVYIYI